ncbi:MAG TPA: 30S ribosomal protein S3 [Anaerolinea thermolimosa]|jgi:small subunit ribosomal protein S3|uniref:Small ribosomal subunit protein uS3 n=1 Tax=Anaerolinea thermolimosa TaxID=229919 RepID=A0A3D1JJ54_9CHLR|nr:30S ribosomal protein S3 [Anaerolinea thermolimosa]GAP05783.1 SSU ribosomal protein S3P [Anaerolinea thermolimosa]HCE17656.1 30S ribosomal protein S3 [Anaerolinea thermolimosa]
MGRKVHPVGYRLVVTKAWEGRWFADGKEYRENLQQDFKIRKMVHDIAHNAGVSRVEVERFPGKVRVIVFTAKPGILIGRKGESVKKIRQDLEALVGKKIDLEIKEIKNPDTDALLVAENLAGQIERRVSYRRAMKRALQQAIRQGAQGIKVEVQGRLSGAEMARSVWLREGRVPLQTLRANIDFARAEALTTYGRIGVKVWVYKGEQMPEAEEKAEPTEGVYVSE